jgi:dipeptidyl aminopeptidase/acylaminoacyl peptidase
MPSIRYHIFHCTNDSAVNIDKHSRKFVEEMKKEGKEITFDIVNDKEHCDLTPEAKEQYYKYIIDAILK